MKWALLFTTGLKKIEQDKSIKKIVAPLPLFFTATITKNRFKNVLSNYDLEFVDSENFKLIEK